jgi:transcriptional regulator with XRE-family HTH domain
MPKEPSHPSVLRSVRKILNLSQPRLAQLVGVETVTIRKIEGGKLKLPPKLATRIAAATGANPLQLLENFEPETPYLALAHPEKLTLENYKQRTKPKLDDDSTLAIIDGEVNMLAGNMYKMLTLSVPKGTVWVVIFALREAVNRVSEDFGLQVKPQKFDPYAARAAQAARTGSRQRLSPDSGNV